MSVSLLASWVATITSVDAATIWNGPVITFSATTSDPTLPINQDRITGNVWITRGSSQGIFNAKTESGFAHSFSPADTAWADGTLANYASLSYTDWNTWVKVVHAGPPSTVGLDAVVHLISDDIYIGIKFTSWGGFGGLFTYERTTAPASASPIPLSISRIGNQVVLTWTNASFSLQTATNVAGPYTNVIGAGSPYTNSLAGARSFFRLIH